MRIIVDQNDFVDIIKLFLLEMIQEEEYPNFGQEAVSFFNELNRKGLKSHLLKSFFKISTKNRNKYNFIRDSFFENEKSHITLYHDDIDKKIEEAVYQFNQGKKADPENIEKFTKILKEKLGEE